ARSTVGRRSNAAPRAATCGSIGRGGQHFRPTDFKRPSRTIRRDYLRRNTFHKPVARVSAIRRVCRQARKSQADRWFWTDHVRPLGLYGGDSRERTARKRVQAASRAWLH